MQDFCVEEAERYLYGKLRQKFAELGQSALGPSRASIVARCPESSLVEASEMRIGETDSS